MFLPEIKSTARALACAPARLLAATGYKQASRPPVSFVTERNNWSIRWDGTYITDGVNSISPGMSALSERPAEQVQKIVHFGSHYMWLTWGHHMSQSNRFVVTYFHGTPKDGPEVATIVDKMMASIPRLDMVVTASSMMEAELLNLGVPRNKLARIPIGVDLNLFHTPTPEQRTAARAKWGITDSHFCIGSFQKDGEGWGEGNTPKMIKGPDVFLDLVQELAKALPVFVLLTGPARGYVIRGLKKIGVPYAHHHVEHYPDLVSFYHALDVYPVTSREEGGPKAITESIATGVPIVSTRVGMAPDIIDDGINGWLVDVEDVAGLVSRCERVAADPWHARSMSEVALASISPYGWDTVAQQHYQKVYQPLMK